MIVRLRSLGHWNRTLCNPLSWRRGLRWDRAKHFHPSAGWSEHQGRGNEGQEPIGVFYKKQNKNVVKCGYAEGSFSSVLDLFVNQCNCSDVLTLTRKSKLDSTAAEPVFSIFFSTSLLISGYMIFKLISFCHLRPPKLEAAAHMKETRNLEIGHMVSSDLQGRYFLWPDSVSLASGPNNLLWRGRSAAPDCTQISATGGLSTGLHRSGHNGTISRYPIEIITPSVKKTEHNLNIVMPLVARVLHFCLWLRLDISFLQIKKQLHIDNPRSKLTVLTYWCTENYSLPSVLPAELSLTMEMSSTSDSVTTLPPASSKSSPYLRATILQSTMPV